MKTPIRSIKKEALCLFLITATLLPKQFYPDYFLSFTSRPLFRSFFNECMYAPCFHLHASVLLHVYQFPHINIHSQSNISCLDTSFPFFFYHNRFLHCFSIDFPEESFSKCFLQIKVIEDLKKSKPVSQIFGIKNSFFERFF